MKLSGFAILGLSVLICCGSSLQATVIGIGPYTGSYAHFDTFPLTTVGTMGPVSGPFTNQAPTTFNSSAFTATLSSSTTGLRTASGDRYYDFGAPSSFTINGTASSAYTNFFLVLKYTSPAVVSADGFYQAQFDGIAPTSATLLGSVTEAGGTFNFMQYYWSGLNVDPSETFALTFGNAVTDQHVSLDGVYVSNVAAIPEPGSIALGCLGVVGAGMLLRRRLKKQAV